MKKDPQSSADSSSEKTAAQADRHAKPDHGKGEGTEPHPHGAAPEGNKPGRRIKSTEKGRYRSDQHNETQLAARRS
jgi:hypothetical protein